MTEYAILISLVAGVFAGLSFCLWRQTELQRDIIRNVDTERKLFINKSLVREGQARIFSDENISGTAKPEPEAAKQAPRTVKSQFQAGLVNKRAEVNEQKRNPTGVNLPESVKKTIVEYAEQVKNQ